MDRIAFTRQQLEQVHGHLVRWTDFYRIYHDRDGDGVIEVPMGCDDQDNGSAFLGAHFVESPDITAYLALQEAALGRICTTLGRDAEAARWHAEAVKRVQSLISHCWDGTQFFHTSDPDHRRVPDAFGSTTIMPLVLGQLLPSAIFAATAARLEAEFLGEHGVASEAFTSPLYEADGYWLGSVWAPLQLLLVDGLRRGGRSDLAELISKRYYSAIARSGSTWEVLDAKTGFGQRASGYIWTAAVVLELLQEASTQPC